MHRHLNLVSSDFEQFEKRLLPKFPFCYLIFKISAEDSLNYEIKDISLSGMQINLKNGETQFKQNDLIHGHIHWGDHTLEIKGVVKWKVDSRAGVEFSSSNELRKQIEEFLEIEKLAKKLKPVHDLDIGLSLPKNLKFWLRADGPIEIFVWEHSNGQYSKFQVVIMENFIEWSDGTGVKTARVYSKRDVDTPLLSSDEFVFKFDETINESILKKAQTLIEKLDETLVPKETLELLNLKIRS